MTSQPSSHPLDPASIVDQIPYARFLGLVIEEAEPGLLFRLPYQDRLVGNRVLPALHGGVVAGFMENAALLQLMCREPRHVGIPKTIDFSIDYLRSAGPCETFAHCEVTRIGWRVAQVQVTCWQDKPDIPLALARAHLMLGSPRNDA